jgi:uncharacterized membrane protein
LQGKRKVGFMYWVFVLGIATGMRALTPMAVLCWVMWFGLLGVSRVNFWTANLFSVVVFTLLALGEYYGDTQPKTPSRLALFPLLARIGLGGAMGALIFSGFAEPVVGGVVFGVAGALAGAYGGHALRALLARRVGNDLPVALGESALALAMSGLAMYMVCADWARQLKFGF